ncbi:MAG: DEAD/DEAH box helicase family protein [Acidobacteria bacterium]|nr:DEAD/DEAH box helicase family protein [Acidobacteriota bacterium]
MQIPKILNSLGIATTKLTKNEQMFLQFLNYESPRPKKYVRKATRIIPSLEQKGLIEIIEDEIQITPDGVKSLENAFQISKYKFSIDELLKVFLLPNRIEAEKQALKKSNEILELRKQGLTLEAIGQLHGLTRERVRQILAQNPDLEEYLKEEEVAKIRSEKEEVELKKQKFLARSLGYLYPERVAELWDYDKNGDLNPEGITAKGIQEIWLKCPKDGHSWKKKANDVSNSWERYKSSGCPMCAGKTKKPEKQPMLAENYFEYVVEYWNFEKNESLGLNPEKLTLGSNYKAWFKCPKDDNEWQASIASTVTQQWSLGNAGCRVCNGTHLRKRGVWGKSGKLSDEFPNEVTRYWNYEKNDELKLKPSDITIGSSRKAWFKCPIDNHEWQAGIAAITKTAWKFGRSGCPACRGWIATDKTSLTNLYPEFTEKYWNYERNKQIGLSPDELTKGVQKQAWFKCPIDGYEWKVRISDITRSSWKLGNSGCPVCKGRVAISKNSLLSLYRAFVVEYWDYEKNNNLEVFPDSVTKNSNKFAWFKCPIDGHKWQSRITGIRSASWDLGNNGCAACSGRVVTDSTSLLSQYPEFISKFWDYERNNEIEIFPDKQTKGSKKIAWFRCPIDNYEWQSRITSIRKASWDLGNSGCARCSGWTTEAIRQFVKSLEQYIPNLTQSERYKLFEQSGILGTQNAEGLKIVKDIIKGKLKGQKLRDAIQGKQIEKIETSLETNVNLDANSELKITATDSSVRNSQNSQDEFGFTEEIEETVDLPKIKVHKSLEFLSSKIVASSDQEAVDFFVASRRNRIWAEVFGDESAVEGIELFADDGYGRQVRDQFLDEYNQARNMQMPSGWAFRIDGKITPPNLMQKVAAVRLKNQKRMLNLSLTGTGKTIGGILSSRIINANLTIIICPLDTIINWHSEIKNVFPDSKVTTKNFNPYWLDVEDGHHFIILNHEMFQQPSTASNIKQLLDRYKIDLIIVDEIHRCKQRSEDPSKRRQMVLALITNATEINPDLHVLGMSATPIINNLKEGKSLVELVTGIERADLAERATINNCMKLHQAFVTLGIRSRVKPKITISRVKIPIDCTHLVDEIRENGTSVLKMEQILTSARIPTILEEIRPKTIIYTHYVEGIVDQLKEAVEAKGWSVGFHIGGDKSGRENFINGSTDVLIASSAMAVGVDGFQRVCDRLILNIPPWTSAELEQLEGRVNRQGQIHDTLTIIFPVTFGIDGEEYWSWDEGRLARLQNKQTIADAAVDGLMPEGQLRTEAQAFRDLRKWLDRLKDGEQKIITRPKIFVPLPDVDESDIKRRYAQYGDFSRMNARWNNSYSSTTHQRLQRNPEEWMQYHTLYQEARKTWSITPYEETIKWLEKRSNLIIGDFGCGEALIAKSLSDKHTIYSFDYIALNDSVIECDVSKVPLEDSELDVAVFNLSLMGLNSKDYLQEAVRTLKLDGQLWIYETESHIKNINSFVRQLELLGLNIIENYVNWKFRYVRAIKSREIPII